MLFYDAAFQEATTLKIYKFSKDHLTDTGRHFYHNYVTVTPSDTLNIVKQTRCEESTKWQRERNIRITGSMCHSLYTYVLKDNSSWETKICKLLGNTFYGNSATRYGKACERKTLDAYFRMTGHAVTQVQFVVHPKLPWPCYSPDGIIFKDGEPEIRLEIEPCPWTNN